jgi:uncharacterized membrane protein
VSQDLHHEHDRREHDPTVGTARLEAFSDGVLAIVITLLVFTIPVPEGVDDLGKALLEQWESYIAFALAFLTVGIIWVNHHELFRLVARTTHGFLVVNVLLLLFVALIPIPTQLLANYLGTEGNNATTALVAYGLVGTCVAAMWNVVWLYAKKHGLLYDDLPAELIAKANRRNLIGTPVYAVEMLLALVSPPASLAFYLLVAGYYLLPARFRVV